MHHHITLPRWGKRLAGAALLAVAVTAGLTGMKLNVSHGLEISAEAGLIYGLADAAKILLPIICGIIGWNTHTKTVAVICVFASLWCASSAYLDGAGREQLARQHGAATYADKAKMIAELERDVARLQAQALTEGKAGGCKQNCRTINDQAATASQRLAAARAEKAATKPVEVSGMAAAISALVGTGINETARGIGVFKALLFLALIEALVWLSIPAMALLAAAAPRRREAEMPVIDVEAEPLPMTEAAPVEPIKLARRAGTSAYYLARLERERPDLAAKVAAGALSVHRASITAGLRKAPAKSKWTVIDAYVPKKVNA
jgi:hypothetical protein